jgi:hypothetical protein
MIIQCTPVRLILMKIKRLLFWLPALFFLCLQARAEHMLWYGKPALPKDWTAGTVRGLKARGNYTVDISWKDNKLVESTILAGKDGICRIQGADFTISKNGQLHVKTVATQEMPVKQDDILKIQPMGQ